jgi:hypothetical protein
MGQNVVDVLISDCYIFRVGDEVDDSAEAIVE